MIINKRNKFVLKIAKNIASKETEQERTDALDALKDDVRPKVATIVAAILSGRKAS